MIRIDKIIFPQWTLKWMYFDFNNYAYICTLVAFNNHNHPIVFSFVEHVSAHCIFFNMILLVKDEENLALQIEMKKKEGNVLFKIID